jgi:hypothetical protein
LQESPKLPWPGLARGQGYPPVLPEPATKRALETTRFSSYEEKAEYLRHRQQDLFFEVRV